MTDIRTELQTLIRNALISLGADVSFSLEYPADMEHGDFATNAALVSSKVLGMNPKEVAEKLIAHMDAHKSEQVAVISSAGPGFINITLARSHFSSLLVNIVSQKEQWGTTTVYGDRKILVEHSSPNLFKPFHIGHLMNNAIGESIVRLAKASGADVRTMSFPSDISLGVAKALFVLLEQYGESFVPSDIVVLGNAYVEGTRRYEEDETVQARVKEITNNLYARTPSPELALFDTCKAFNIAYFEQVTKKLGSEFDSYIYESEAGEHGKEIVQKYTPSIFTESEGATVYIPEESKKHLNTLVFINSQGNPTYEAKDIGLLAMKFERENPDTSIFITDSHQVPHFQVVLDAAEKIDATWSEKSVHRYHGRMSFKGQKMSSRLGGVPLADDVLTTIIEEVKERAPELDEEAVSAIAIAALKFSILRATAGKDINFDPETSLSFEGDSGPYLQYTAVRSQSVLQKGCDAGYTPSNASVVSDTLSLERMLSRFPAITERAIFEWAPHHMVSYLLEVSQMFNSWYAQQKIITDDAQETAYRLMVTQAVGTTITNGLWLLGIPVPKKM